MRIKLFVFAVVLLIVFSAGCSVSGYHFSNGKLVIESDEPMRENFGSERPPWYGFRDQIQEIIIEKNVTWIPVCAFENCVNLKEIVIPDNVKTVGQEAFAGCESLEKISFCDGINFGRDPFINTKWYYSQKDGPLYLNNYVVGCTGKCEKQITIKNGTKYIIDDAFDYFDDGSEYEHLTPEYESVRKIVIPDSVLSIGSCSFYGCTNVREIEIGSGVKNIDSLAFRWDNLNKLVVKSRTVKFDNVFKTEDTYGESIEPYDKCTVYCYKDSPAYKFAKKHGLIIKLFDK